MGVSGDPFDCERGGSTKNMKKRSRQI